MRRTRICVNGERGGTTMTLCPIALAVGCNKCPAFKMCPLKAVIGDYKPDAAEVKVASASASGETKPRK
jgi:hypothetical protein